MAVLPQFAPPQAPGAQANISVQSQSAAQSWMDQAQMRQISQQKQDNAQTLFNMALPVAQAKNDADLISAQNQLSVGTQIQKFRAQASTDGPAAQQEYLDGLNVATNDDGTPDWHGQHLYMQELAGRYNSLNTLPEWQPIMKQINDASSNAWNMETKQQVAAAALARVQAAASGRLDVAQVGAGARTDAANISAGARVDTANIGAQGRQGVADTMAGARTDAANTGAQGRLLTAKVKEWGAAAQQADAQAAAIEAVDPEAATVFKNKAQQYRDAIQAASLPTAGAAPGTATGGAGFKIPNVALNGASTPDANIPTVDVAGAKHVVINGKAYPLVQNKATGQSAFVGDDGKRHPLPAAAPADDNPDQDQSAQ